MVKKAIFPNLKKKVNLFLIINAFFMIPCCALAETVAKWDSEKDLFTVQSNNVTVKDVLNYIEKNSKYIFIYSEGVQKTLTDKVSISVDNKKIDVILSELSKKTGLKYKIVGRQITISRPEVESLQQDTRKGVRATGNVKDDKGEPLIGASVLVKGTTNGTITGIDGDFTLANVKKGDILEISFLGYKTTTVTFQGSKISVILHEDSETLSEVVVVGFGVQKKASVVGSVESIKPAELKIPSSSLSNAFGGRIAGVITMQQNAEPGADGASFWIRGAATFSGTTNPLIYIDGVESSTDDMNALPPEAIENFSVLKDASATALYGARGANGVILITTRSGKDMEKARINIRIENTFSQPTRTLKLADAATTMETRNAAVWARNPEATAFYTQERIDNTRNRINPYLYPDVDWVDVLFKDMSMNQTANINVMGGTSKVDYFLSATLNNDNGQLKQDKNNSFDNNLQNLRYSIQGNIGAWLTKTTKATIRLNTQIEQYTGPTTSVPDLYQFALRAPSMYFLPYYPNTINADHVLFGNSYENASEGSGYHMNPYAEMVRGRQHSAASTINASLELEQKLDFITKGLSFKALINFKNYSYTYYSRTFNPYYYRLDSADPLESGGYDFQYTSMNQGSTALTLASNGSSGDRYMNIQALLNYQRTFANKHDVGALFVYLQRDYNVNNPGDYYATLPQRNQGIAGRVTYAYDGKYLAEANFGYNGSETFQKGSRFGFFPSFAVGYMISNEEFFKPLNGIFTSLKLRASYGLVGNSDIGSGRFPYLTKVNLNGGGSYQFGKNWDNSASGTSISTYGADNVTWEIGEKYDIGVDMTLFKDLNFTIDYFRENRKNIFLQRQTISVETGITGTAPYGNLGRVKNEGLDMSFNYNHSFNKDFFISARGTFTLAKNEYVERDEPPYEYSYMSQVGQPLNNYYGYIAEGLFQSEDEIADSPTQELGTYKTQVGDIKYKDLNGDGKIDGTDKTYIGNPSVPQIIYGFGASMQYKGWDASFFFQGVAKRDIMLQGIHSFTGNTHNLMQWVVDNYWREDGANPSAEYPRLTNGSNPNTTEPSTYWLKDGSYIRLKNVELGYTWKFLRAYVAGANLLTFSKFKIWDPELNTQNGQAYPTQRTVSVGLQMTF